MACDDDLRFALITGAWVVVVCDNDETWRGRVSGLDRSTYTLVQEIRGTDVIQHRLRTSDVRRVVITDRNPWAQHSSAGVARLWSARLLIAGAAMLAARVVLEGGGSSRELLGGLDVESRFGLGCAVALSLAMAALIERRRWGVSVVSVVLALALSWFDVVETLHLAQESRLGLAALAAIVGVVHLATSVVAGAAINDGTAPRRNDRTTASTS